MKFSNREFILLAIILALVSIVSLSFFFENESHVQEADLVTLLNQEVDSAESDPSDEILDTANAEEILYMVDVKGAILYPGVYEIEQGKRVIDAVNLAGGFLKDANVNRVNLASLLEDEMVIYIPAVGEEIEAVEEGIFQTTSKKEQEGLININVADADDLQSLPGIGPSKANAIIAYREEHGPFQRIEDLLNVTGIGEKSLEKMKEKLRVK